jgi:hypothetical protein
MKKQYHLMSTAIFLIVFAYFDKITVTLCIAAFIYGLVPDLDQLKGIKQFIGHRWFLSHSIIIWIIVGVFNPDPIFVLIPAIIGFHCLMDVRWVRNQQKGYYTISIMPGWRLNGFWSTIWLLVNFIVSFTFLIGWCLIL